MINQTCCFTGHRKIPLDQLESVTQRLRDAVIASIKYGYLYFGAGGALGFDTLAAQTVLDLKKDYPQIKLILVLPCKTQTRGWKQEDIEEYNRIMKAADKVVYTSQDYYNGCMHKRNRHLVDNSSLCICYLTERTGGTAYTIDLAKSCTNCADVTVEGNTTKKLQPGSQGSFMVKVDASSSSVKTNANVVMYNLTVGGNSTIPAGLRFYVLDGASERTLTTSSLTTGSGVSIYSNTWEADAANKTGEQTVYWAWDYAAANDNAFQGKTINFALKAEAEQATE